jgi:hypothetical protein
MLSFASTSLRGGGDAGPPSRHARESNVTLERWQEAKGILAGARERPAEIGRAYLGGSCADPSLRREVESLLAAHENGNSSFLDPPASRRSPRPSRNELPAGSRLSHYEILAPKAFTSIALSPQTR